MLLFMVISLLSSVATQSYEKEQNSIPDEKWGYVNVRPKAHMFWWSYGALNTEMRADVPLILWLQGGPGASGTGFGNFYEIGPLDTDGNPRNTTWLSKANLLFIDNPVGAGFSYVDDPSALTTNVSGIAEDLFVALLNISSEIPAFKSMPFYVFCESYGGKMTTAFGDRLYRGIQSKEIECNFKGVALGDSWISPVDSTLSWGPYLYQFNLLDEKDLANVNEIAQGAETAVNNGDYVKATQMWQKTEEIIDQRTDHVNVYNVLQHNNASPFYNMINPLIQFPPDINYLESLYRRHVGVYQHQSLFEFMNGPIRQKLHIIPDHVKWGGQSDLVFKHQAMDFMKPVIKTVSKLISYGLKVVVFQGQLDMICDTPAAETWIKKLDWPKLRAYHEVDRKPLYVGKDGNNTQGFVKTFENFSLYYIMNAGHMVPLDNGPMALEMVKHILNST